MPAAHRRNQYPQLPWTRDTTSRTQYPHLREGTMTREPRHHPHPSDTAQTAAYRAAVLRGAVSGAVHALITWLLEH